MRAHRQHAHGRTPDLPQAQGAHRYPQQLDDVHDGEGERHAAVRAVDAQGHRPVPLGVERHQLGRDAGGHRVVQRPVQDDDPLFEEPLRQRLGPFAFSAWLILHSNVPPERPCTLHRGEAHVEIAGLKRATADCEVPMREATSAWETPNRWRRAVSCPLRA